MWGFDPRVGQISGRMGAVETAGARIGEILRRTRKEQKRTLGHMAEACRFTASYLSMIETGRIRRPLRETLRRIARAYGVPAEELIAILNSDRPERKSLRRGREGSPRLPGRPRRNRPPMRTGAKGPTGPRPKVNPGLLAATRIGMGLTLAKMAERCGVTSGYLCRIEAGLLNTMRTDQLPGIARAYGVGPAHLQAMAMGAPSDLREALAWLRERSIEMKPKWAIEYVRVADALEAEAAG